jgi:ankyrin repeat protein
LIIPEEMNPCSGFAEPCCGSSDSVSFAITFHSRHDRSLSAFFSQDGATPLYIAACRNSKEVAELLVRAGADVTRQYKVRCPALSLQIQRRVHGFKIFCLSFMLICALQGWTPLAIARKRGFTFITNLLERAAIYASTVLAAGRFLT